MDSVEKCGRCCYLPLVAAPLGGGVWAGNKGCGRGSWYGVILIQSCASESNGLRAVMSFLQAAHSPTAVSNPRTPLSCFDFLSAGVNVLIGQTSPASTRSEIWSINRPHRDYLLALPMRQPSDGSEYRPYYRFLPSYD